MSLRWLYGATAAALMSLLCFGTLTWSRRLDLSAGELYGERLGSLLALNLRLTGEVLKAHSGIIGHYDAIVQSQAALKRLYAELDTLPSFLPEAGRAALRSRLDAAGALARDSERMVERFKREQAVLRNSLHYLPALAHELDVRLTADKRVEPLRRNLQAIVRDELLLQLWQDDALVERIDSQLAELEQATAVVAEHDDIETVVLHARAVRERTPIVNDLTRRIVALPTVERTRSLMASFAQYYRAAMDRADADRVAIFGLALLALSLIAASIIARLRQAAASLRKTSAQLEQTLGELRMEQAKQKELADLKGRFVSMASHEFRTPLSVIMSSGELLEAYADRWSAERKREHFGRIHSAAQAMTKMLDSILMLGRSDAGALCFEPKLLDIDNFCEELRQAVGHSTGEPQRIVYRASPCGRVVADQALLKSILENLLSNALKYSPASRPVAFEVARAGKELVFSVRDEGIGISVEDRPHLFESFHRGKNVGTVSGTGLGLAIVKRALDLHGGSVSFDSELGVGTRFTVRIPCEAGGT